MDSSDMTPKAASRKRVISVRQSFYTFTSIALVTLGVSTALLLVALSPLALHGIASIITFNWANLGNIGQTYGAVSAVISTLALSGIAFSLIIQARESRHNRLRAVRARQQELMRMALEDPLYLQVWGPSMKYPQDTFKQYAYINLVLESWKVQWRFKDLDERQLRLVLLYELFGSPAGRSYWRDTGGLRLTMTYDTRRGHRFETIADEEYRKALSKEPHPVINTNSSRYRPHMTQEAVAVISALALGAVIGRFISGRR